MPRKQDAGSRRYDDSVALISGVSDRGIGGAIVERLAEEGASVVVAWYQVPPERILRRLSRMGAAHLSVECDITRQRAVDTAVAACLDQFGRIDVLVNNAGVESSNELASVSDYHWQRTIEVNLSGAMRLTRAVLPHLSTDGGVVISIASVLGLAGSPEYSAYSASKAGLIGMTQSLALELAPRRQRAVCVAPALVLTPMVQKHLSGMSAADKSQTEAGHPLGIGHPQDVAAAVAFLASQDARWISGVTLPLGWLNGYPLPAPKNHELHGISAPTPAGSNAPLQVLPVPTPM